VARAEPRESDEGEEAPRAHRQELGKVELEVADLLLFLLDPVDGDEPEHQQHVVQVNLKQCAQGVQEPTLRGQSHRIERICNDNNNKEKN